MTGDRASFKPEHLRSLRDYIERLSPLGEIAAIDATVDWNLEMGAIIRRSTENGLPSPLFNSVKDDRDGFRVLGAPASLSNVAGQRLAKIAISLGLPPATGADELVERLSRVLENKPIAPRLVENAPFRANVRQGAEVDLTSLPVPLIHGGDGGRFINTWGTIVARTPDRTWTNWSIARIMLRDRNTMVGIVSPQKHVGRVHKMWQEIGKPMPFALSLGHDPVIPYFSGMPLPDGVSEGPVIGGYLGEPIDVAQCATVDLQVPASSEIVIEGELTLDEFDEEGPMAEYPGYIVPGSKQMRPVYRVSALSYRQDAILPVVAAGYPPEENHTCWGIAIAAVVQGQLRDQGWPVTACFVPFEAACHLLVVTVPSDWRRRGPYGSARDFARNLGEAVFATRGGTVVPRVLVVTDDIDPSNPAEVLWAMVTRVHPGEGEIMFPHLAANPLNAFMSGAEKKAMFTAKCVLDGLPRDDWMSDDLPVRADFERLYPADLQQRVVSGWSSVYGLRSPT